MEQNQAKVNKDLVINSLTNQIAGLSLANAQLYSQIVELQQGKDKRIKELEEELEQLRKEHIKQMDEEVDKKEKTKAK